MTDTIVLNKIALHLSSQRKEIAEHPQAGKAVCYDSHLEQVAGKNSLRIWAREFGLPRKTLERIVAPKYDADDALLL